MRAGGERESLRVDERRRIDAPAFGHHAHVGLERRRVDRLDDDMLAGLRIPRLELLRHRPHLVAHEATAREPVREIGR